MKLTAIMAMSDDGVIGTTTAHGAPCLPWQLPPDMKRFRELTTGHAIIMGRVTWDSIGRPLPKRKNIVVSRTLTPGYFIDDLAFQESPERALLLARSVDPEPFVIGGGEIWRALWSYVTRIEMTRVRTTIGHGLVFGFDPAPWRVTNREPPQEHHGLGYEFVTYERT
jgi:dihydrofolate reductase